MSENMSNPVNGLPPLPDQAKKNTKASLPELPEIPKDPEVDLLLNHQEETKVSNDEDFQTVELFTPESKESKIDSSSVSKESAKVPHTDDFKTVELFNPESSVNQPDSSDKQEEPSKSNSTADSSAHLGKIEPKKVEPQLDLEPTTVIRIDEGTAKPAQPKKEEVKSKRVSPSKEEPKKKTEVRKKPPVKKEPVNEEPVAKPKSHRVRNTFTVLFIIGIICEIVVASIGVYILGTMIQDVPELNVTDFIGEESSHIYDDEGTLVTEVGVYLRENVEYSALPESLIDAFLSVEDSRYFTHNGFDVPRFMKAAIENLKTRDFSQGGSTFTMQLVKNTYFSVEGTTASDTGTTRTKSIEYKVQQIYLSIQLEKLLSKQEIFTLYLNKLNFGGNIRGVQRASQYYFGKDVTDLTLAESAMLAGIVNLPNRYNPYSYLDYATTRRDEVLNLMLYHGYITETEYNLAKAVKLEDTLVGDNREANEDSQYQAYIDTVLDEVTEMTGYDPTIKGMEIYTYLNRDMQDEVEAIQNGERSSVVYPDDLMQVAMISVDNTNGAIVAIGGGRNYDGARLLNRATMNYKQPGSSVKPILSYALAFEYLGYTMDEVLIDKPITYPNESMVLVNASGKYNGDVTIKDAVGNSLNIPAILTLERVVDKVGRETVVDYLQSIGFSKVTDESFNYSYAIGGTSFETTCKELAGAHGMIINGGVYNEPHTIQKIVLSHDGTVYTNENVNKQTLSSGSSYMACLLMENNVTGPYYNYMQILKRDYPVYAKTGTTDWGTDGVQYGIPEGQMKDKWMVASTTHFTNVVWVGYDMAIAGKETYFTSYKSSLNIPGNINKLLLDKEEELYGAPEEMEVPDDLTEITYAYGTYPHVAVQEGGQGITSMISETGLKNAPIATMEEYREYQIEDMKRSGMNGGLSASVDQGGNLHVSWGSSGACENGQKDISLHDDYNDIEQYGTCLVDLSYLLGGGSYWATVYCDNTPVGEISSENGSFSGYVADLYGEIKVCGGGTNGTTTLTEACVVATYKEQTGGYYDENGNWIDTTSEYDQYGYWDENGNWIGEGWWDADGFHYPE